MKLLNERKNDFTALSLECCQKNRKIVKIQFGLQEVVISEVYSQFKCFSHDAGYTNLH